MNKLSDEEIKWTESPNEIKPRSAHGTRDSKNKEEKTQIIKGQLNTYAT